MDFVTLLGSPYMTSLGITPAVSTRPASALLLVLTVVGFSGANAPVWLFNLPVFLFLIVFALVEWNVGKDMAFMELIEAFMPIAKVVLTVLVTLALLNTDVANVNEALFAESAIEAPSILDGVGQFIWSAVMGVLTWFASIYRNSFLFFISEFDEDNDLGLLSLYSWMETLFTASSVLLALFLPLLAIALFIGVAIGLRWLRKYLEEKEEQQRIACSHDCGTTIYPIALSCPTCYQKNPTPMQVGLLGQITTKYVTDRNAHQWQLLAQKRCPRCATRFRGRDMHKICEACGTSVLDSPEAVHAYVKMFDDKLFMTLGACFGFGLIPFIGLIAGVVTYRLTLVSPMRRFVPATQGCVGRWGTRLFNLIMVSLQPIPILGAFVLPAMCFVNYKIYREMLVRAQYRPNAPQPPKAQLA